MRVKVGDCWFTPAKGVPVMIELTDADKRSIARMAPEVTRYAVVVDGDPLYDRNTDDRSKVTAWMDEGATAPNPDVVAGRLSEATR